MRRWQPESCPYFHPERLWRTEPHDAGRHRAQMRVEWPHRPELEGGGQVR